MAKEKIKNEEGKLPYGTCSEKERKKFIKTFLLSLLALVIVLIEIIFEIAINNLVIGLILIWFIVTLYILFLITNKMNNDPLIKANNKFYETLNFEEFEKSIEEISKENLHSETIKLVMCYYANNLFTVDMKKAIEIIDNIDIPTSNFVRHLYDIMQILKYVNLDNQEEVKCLLDIYNSNKKYNKLQFSQMKKQINKVYISRYTEEVIEKLNEDKKPANKFLEIDKYLGLMLYYDKRKNKEKAIYYANKILEMNSNLHEYNNSAKQILELNN